MKPLSVDSMFFRRNDNNEIESVAEGEDQIRTSTHTHEPSNELNVFGV